MRLQEEHAMSIPLPTVIESYFAAANTDDAERIAHHFAQHAQVKDEGRWREGRAEIEAWARESREKFQFTATPVSVEQDGDAPIVTARVEGDFPGSPVMLRYRFELQGGEIERLEIV
jgi:ketosteroid isomerase-like protein